MEIGMSSASFYPMVTEQAVEELAKLGFRNVELFLNCESEFTPEFCRMLRGKLDAFGINVISIHSYTAAIEGIYFFSDYKRRTEESIGIYHKYFTAAEILGARYFSFHGDRSSQNREYFVPRIERHCEVFTALAHAAAEHGILIAQENVSWCVSANPEYVRLLRENLGDTIGFTLDLKQARRAGVDWREYVEAMGDRLVNLHVSDELGEKTSLLPGCGKFNYHQFFRFLRDKNYQGCALIEVYRQDFGNFEEILQAKAFLEAEMN